MTKTKDGYLGYEVGGRAKGKGLGGGVVWEGIKECVRNKTGPLVSVYPRYTEMKKIAIHSSFERSLLESLGVVGQRSEIKKF